MTLDEKLDDALARLARIEAQLTQASGRDHYDRAAYTAIAGAFTASTVFYTSSVMERARTSDSLATALIAADVTTEHSCGQLLGRFADRGLLERLGRSGKGQRWRVRAVPTV